MANTTFNPSDKTANVALSNGDLTATLTGSGSTQAVRGIHRHVTGKFYFEATYNTVVGGTAFGICKAGLTLTTLGSSGFAQTQGIAVLNTIGQIFVDGTQRAGTGAIASGTVCGCAFDLGTGMIWFRIGAAGNWNFSATANPAAGLGGFDLRNFLTGFVAVYPVVSSLSPQGTVVTANYGDSAFAGTVPSGFTSGFPTNTPALQAAYADLDRESLIADPVDTRISWLAREALINPGGVDLAGIAREALLERGGLQLSGMAREALLEAGPIRYAFLARETLLTAPDLPPTAKQSAVTVNTG